MRQVANFSGDTMTGIDLSESKMLGIDFRRVNLATANLRSADSAKLSGIVFPDPESGVFVQDNHGHTALDPDHHPLLVPAGTSIELVGEVTYTAALLGSGVFLNDAHAGGADELTFLGATTCTAKVTADTEIQQRLTSKYGTSCG